MSMSYRTTGLARTIVWRRRDCNAFRSFWDAFQDWRKRERLRRDLCNLTDRELMDIGIARSEIEYVASNRDTDLQGIRSA